MKRTWAGLALAGVTAILLVGCGADVQPQSGPTSAVVKKEMKEQLKEVREQAAAGKVEMSLVTDLKGSAIFLRGRIKSERLGTEEQREELLGIIHEFMLMEEGSQPADPEKISKLADQLEAIMNAVGDKTE